MILAHGKQVPQVSAQTSRVRSVPPLRTPTRAGPVSDLVVLFGGTAQHGGLRLLTAAQTRIQQIPQGIAEHIKAEHCGAEGDPGPDGQPGGLIHIAQPLQA